jgi:hypothetical protein
VSKQCVAYLHFAAPASADASVKSFWQEFLDIPSCGFVGDNEPTDPSCSRQAGHKQAGQAGYKGIRRICPRPCQPDAIPSANG